MPPKHRDIAPFLQMVRDFLLGRKHVTSHRHADNMSSRSPPPPAVAFMSPLSKNSYYLRDARSEVKPPIDLVEEKKRKLAAIAAAEEAAIVKAAEEAAKNASSSTLKPASNPVLQPATPPKTCQQGQSKKSKSKGSKKLPTPGKTHCWD